MSREDRAKQFAPFDALKGLSKALRIKEYEHEKIEKGEISEEKILKISQNLLKLSKKDKVKVVFFKDGHYLTKYGNAKVIYEKQLLEIEDYRIKFDDLYDLEIIEKG